MSKIWLTSDWHFGHDKEFIWKVRGYNSIQEMNEGIIAKHNSLVEPDDIVYCLGDCVLGDINNVNYIAELNGQIKIIRGNHDTDRRVETYKILPNIEYIGWAEMIKYQGYHFYLSHYPTLTSNMDEGTPLKARVLNLYGHTHQNTNFYNENPLMYHVGMDSHNCYPISLDSIIEEIKEKTNECLSFL
jgi:calcineurin-like phosphoesterase family protein